MAKLIEDNRVLDNLLKTLNDLESMHVEAGIVENEPHPTYDWGVASLGALYEYGYENDRGNRVRASFIEPVDNSKHMYLNTVLSDFTLNIPRLFKGSYQPKDILSDIGIEMSTAYKDYIESDSVKYKVNGYNYPKNTGIRLIESSTLVDSITYSVEHN